MNLATSTVLVVQLHLENLKKKMFHKKSSSWTFENVENKKPSTYFLLLFPHLEDWKNESARKSKHYDAANIRQE